MEEDEGRRRRVVKRGGGGRRGSGGDVEDREGASTEVEGEKDVWR